jgi:hypothetical protein
VKKIVDEGCKGKGEELVKEFLGLFIGMLDFLRGFIRCMIYLFLSLV